jgi:hypothetical protein
MARLIIHNPSLSREEIDELRLKRTLELPLSKRINNTLAIMAILQLFRKGGERARELEKK